MRYLVRARGGPPLLVRLGPLAATLLMASAGCSSDAGGAEPRSAAPSGEMGVPMAAAPTPAVTIAPAAVNTGAPAEPMAPTDPAPPAEPPALIVAESEPTEPVVTEVPEDDACASAGVETERPPITLMFALDTSGSMVNHGADAFRWNPVSVALKAFFNDLASAGLSAAVQLFPKGPLVAFINPIELTDSPICAIETYSNADVPVTALPDPGVFEPFIDNITPAGGTPTKQALEGLILQSETVVQSSPNTRVAMILVSDGVPASCGSSVESTADTVAAVADRFPTYVIGVGDSVDNLNAIAKAGGTETALLVDVADPALTRQTVLERLNEIRGIVASCDVVVPEPPAGETLEPNNVTALIQPEGSERVAIPYEQDCASGEGFRYDNPAAPKTITLCEKACATLKSQTASVRVLFGCALKPGQVR